MIRLEVEVKVKGKIMGFQRDDETPAEAASRLVLGVEMRANERGNPRLHLSIDSVMIKALEKRRKK